MFRRRHTPAPPALPPRDDELAPETERSWRSWLFGTLSGRLILVAAIIKLVAAAVQRAMPLPTALRALNGAATLVLLGAVAYLLWRGAVSVKRRLLWRVRRKLIVSYVFIGFVPTLLVIGFFLFGGLLMFMNISAYLFKDGYDDLVQEMRVFAQGLQLELKQDGTGARAVIERRVATNRAAYPDLSIALVPVSGAAGPAPITAGPWWHLDPPGELPAWMRPDGFAGTLAFAPADAPQEHHLLIRALEMPPPGGSFAVVVDVPVMGQVIEHLRDLTSIKAGALTIQASAGAPAPQVGRRRGAPAATEVPAAPTRPVSLYNFEGSVAVLEFSDWASGRRNLAFLSLNVRLRDLYDRISAVQGMVGGDLSLGQLFLIILVVVAVLFLIIEFVALVMGFALARSITSSVHELFMGTERVRQGDFTHRIVVRTRDQLGELADSFNQMTGSIEDLLQQAAEKKRLEEELRIAREIQMSLLPPGPLIMPGLAVTAICVPAREVGGDYYDFFPLGERRVGVLIADVAGKGAFAALYMAELKGLVLSLSQIHQSPRRLLIDVNRILAENLHGRSFITMTYVVLDLGRQTMTYARAGHTPMIHVPADDLRARVLAPSGMVVGLRLPGAEEKFSELLEEVCIPLRIGDVFVLFTDGISEAMNEHDELFGEPRLSRLVEEHAHLEATELRERIVREVQAFVGSAEQHDDQTMILIKVEDAGRRPILGG